MVSRERAAEMAYCAGGDFELVFTVGRERMEAARQACQLTVIAEAMRRGFWMESRGRVRREGTSAGLED